MIVFVIMNFVDELIIGVVVFAVAFAIVVTYLVISVFCLL